MIDKSFASPIPKPSKLSINRMKSATRITEIGPRPLKNTYGAQSSESITRYTFGIVKDFRSAKEIAMARTRKGSHIR
jgi:hypothetical protein